MAEEKLKKKAVRAKVNETAAQESVQENENTIDLYELLLKFLDKWRWIALCAIIGAIALLLYTSWFVTPLYKATAKIYVVSSKDSVINLSDMQISNYLANDYKEVFSNWELHESVRQSLIKQKQEGSEDLKDIDPDKYSYSKLNKMISITNPSNTRILYVTVTSSSPTEAAVLANAYVSVSREFIVKKMASNEPIEFEHALKPSSPSSPNVTRNALLGFIAGALLSMVVIALRFIVDDYVRTSDDIEKYLHLPTLGTIMLQKQSDDDVSEEKESKKHHHSSGRKGKKHHVDSAE